MLAKSSSTLLPLKTEVGYNLDTQINRTYLSKPPPVMIKINPVHGIEGPINIAGQVWATYFSEIEWMPICTGLLTQNMNTLPSAESDAWSLSNLPSAFNMVNPLGLTSWQQAYTYETPTIVNSRSTPSHRYQPYGTPANHQHPPADYNQRGLPFPGSAPQPIPQPFGYAAPPPVQANYIQQ